MRDPETGNSKGFAFINFASFEASDAALEAMNGQYLCNRPITISYAFKKESKGERHGSAAGNAFYLCYCFLLSVFYTDDNVLHCGFMGCTEVIMVKFPVSRYYSMLHLQGTHFISACSACIIV